MWILDVTFGVISFLAMMLSIFTIGLEKREDQWATATVAQMLYRIAVLLWLMRILGVLLLIARKVG